MFQAECSISSPRCGDSGDLWGRRSVHRGCVSREVHSFRRLFPGTGMSSTPHPTPKGNRSGTQPQSLLLHLQLCLSPCLPHAFTPPLPPPPRPLASVLLPLPLPMHWRARNPGSRLILDTRSNLGQGLSFSGPQCRMCAVGVEGNGGRIGF